MYSVLASHPCIGDLLKQKWNLVPGTCQQHIANTFATFFSSNLSIQKRKLLKEKEKILVN